VSTVTYVKSFLRHAAANRAETGRGPLDQLRDFVHIVRHSLYPFEYYHLSMYEGIPEGYVSTRQYRRLERTLNPRQTGVVNFDKWHQYCFFRANGLPAPEVLGFVSGRRGVLDGRPFFGDPAELLRVVDAASKPVVAKPFGGGHGHGFDLILDCSPEAGTLTLKKGGTVSAAAFLDRVADDPEGLLLQRYIAQHPEIARFAPSSVNTLRVLTVLTESGRVEFPAAIMKMSREGTLVDNVGAGGIAAHMDLDTGMLGRGFVWPGKDTYDHHPESGARITGFSVPFWQETLALAALAHQHLTSARSLGWDVAITADGPLLVEMNSYVSIPVYQRLGYSVRRGVLAKMLER